MNSEFIGDPDNSMAIEVAAALEPTRVLETVSGCCGDVLRLVGFVVFSIAAGIVLMA